MTFIAQLAEDLIERGLVARAGNRGCSEQEISDLMQSQRVEALPESYREFLEYSGRDPYWLTHEGEWNYDWILDAKNVARDIVVEDYKGEFSSFENSFIFQTHQGYMFFYFREEDLHAADPRFWIFKGGSPVQMSSLTFNQWLADLARTLPEELRLRQKLYGR
ncbi:SMI1/KNR4 family protein [Nocardia sp. NBC_01329]|uniref:SMI1/KNR4 family protein n=1 Tax=Nocardia sp. NBC_01329 TaxID=2903594 RepID=UPI002E132A60|nr:SMI1/KNR4 family protein [Nocardia sp. NBC_01329]